MALPTKTELKAVLRIQSTAEDTLLDALIARAQALCEAYLRRPITAIERTFVLEEPKETATKTIRRLYLPVYPVAAEASAVAALTLTDDDGDELLEDTDFRLDLALGRISAIGGVVFDTWPYTIVATVGLSAAEDYSTVVEPAVSMAILDLAADLYQRRNAAATSETDGGGVATSYDGSGLPRRVRDTLAPFVLRAPA